MLLSVTLFDDADPTYSVAALGAAINGAVHRAFPEEVWVRGEIRDLSRPPSGHVYFRLVEAGASDRPGGTVTASISVMLAQSNKTSINRTLRQAGGVRMIDGTSVRIRARVDWYTPRGQLQLQMTAIDPAHTLGQLAAERAAVLAALETDGLVGRQRALPMPVLPMRLGLVTSRGSDAEHDVVEELRASGFGFALLTFDARVQGNEAPASIATGLSVLDGRCDLILLVRGGGGATDLQAFDSERIARAIAACGTPVCTGIGHERDNSVADEVAAQSHKTPTACAQAVVTMVRAQAERAESAWSGVADRASSVLDGCAGHLATTARLLARSARGATNSRLAHLERVAARVRDVPGQRLDRSERRLVLAAGRLVGASTNHLRSHDGRAAGVGARVTRAAHAGLRAADHRVAGTADRLRLLDPATLLERGWSVTRGPDGRVVRSVDDVVAGDRVRTTVADGDITSTVE